MKINIITDIRYAFFYFFVVVCLGIFLRWAYVVPIPFEYNYRYILHAHSHTAFLGWMYVLLSGLISREFISSENEKAYRKLFYLTQFSVLGMLFSFPFQGYGAFSIAFASLFVLVSYYYAYFFFVKSKENRSVAIENEKRDSFSYRFIKMGIFYLILSSLGIWAIPFSIVQFGKDSEFYRASIAFFLHFQYNGWIYSTLLGLFIRKFDWEQRFPQLVKNIFYGFQFSVVGTLVISWLGIYPLISFYVIGGVFAFLWFGIILILFFLYFSTAYKKSYLATLFLLFFLLKVCVMIFGTIVGFSQPIFANPDLMISYLHLNFLGVITVGLLFFLKAYGMMKINGWSVLIYLVAFLLTEALMAYKGFSVWLGLPIFDDYFLFLAVASVLFFVPALWWFGSSLRLKKR